MKKIILPALLCAAMFAGAQTTNLKPMFNGKDLSGWTKYLQKQGVNKDPKNVITVKENTIHVTGEEFGYIITDKVYNDFHLSLEFKWGEKKFPPRLKDKRDAGICFSVDLVDHKIWPKSAECQIQEGDVGDLWLIDSVTAFVDGLQTEPRDYERVVKIRDGERKHGEWNKVEVIYQKGRFKFLVNGILVNEGEYLSIASGRILLQSEGAEVFYRDVKIEEY
ncbi:MAG: DUF1080 domain-containing protein [Pedobacter sp.]|nr:MAG: DUF1080 domain-containing protein [Pedobacter sp.]